MPALIPELIAMASDPAIKTTDLLRKAMVAARLLKQHEWSNWISHELQGYPADVALPSYRLLHGELKVLNPVRGLIPLHVGDPELSDMLSECRFNHPIAALEELAIPGKTVRSLFTAEQIELVMKNLQLSMVPEVSLGSNQVRTLIEEVRNQVLTWALDLADAGIQGEGMSFTQKEQQQAQQLAPVTNIQIHGNVQDSQLMLNSPGSQQQQTVTHEQKTDALVALLPWLQQLIAEEQLHKDVRAELQAELDTLRAQAISPKPKWPVISAVAGSVRAILEGAGGGILSGQAIGWLATLMAS